MVVAGHAEGLEAKTLRGVQRTIQMIGLGGHHDALGAEHVLRTIHALVRGEACMVAEDVVARHALGDGVVLHHLHLVVRHRAVVTAHDELRRHTFLVERDAVVRIGKRKIEYYQSMIDQEFL